MKKLFLILLILIFGLPCFAKPNYSYTIEPVSQTPDTFFGTYVDEESESAPVTQIGLPEQYTKPQVEEKGLEIEWNEWHARVRNYVNDNIYKNIPIEYTSAEAWRSDRNSSAFFMVYTVHKTGEITDIILMRFSRTYLNEKYTPYKITTVKDGKIRFKPEFDVCMEKMGENGFKNFTYAINQDTILSSKTILDTFKNSTFVKQASWLESVWVTNTMAKRTVKNIERFSYKPFLKFPEKSKRDKVVVTQGFSYIENLENFSIDEYDASNFNDIEKVSE